MKKIEIKLKQDAIAPLLDFIKPFADRLKEAPDIDPQLPDDVDPEMSESWIRDLEEHLARDSGTLMSIFDQRFMEEGTIEITPENADPVLRASAAIRLRLRRDHLNGLPDEALEKGELDFEKLSPETRRGYACYLFLAGIQEVVIDHLDIIHGTG
jgi:hypothetical protein